MFNKKLLLGALAVLGTTAALIGCSTEPEFEQNTSSYEVPEHHYWSEYTPQPPEDSLRHQESHP